jgi:hypothetical protein
MIMISQEVSDERFQPADDESYDMLRAKRYAFHLRKMVPSYYSMTGSASKGGFPRRKPAGHIWDRPSDGLIDDFSQRTV